MSAAATATATAAATPRKFAGNMTAEELVAVLAAGAVIVGVRTFPYPHAYYLATADGTYREEDQLAEATVRAFVRAGHLTPRPEDALWDRLQCTLSESGRQAAGGAHA